MKKYINIIALVLILSSCLYVFIRSQSNHTEDNITNIIEESTQATISPSNKQASQESSQTIVPPEQVITFNSKEAVNSLTKEEQKYNQTILDNLVQFQKLAKQYCQQSVASKSEVLLMASFLRCGEERYTNELWSKIAGECEEFREFIEKQDNNQAALNLQETKFFYDPVTGEKIDFTHLMATLSVYLNQDLVYQYYPIVGDIGGWAGDCIQLAGEAKKAQVMDIELKTFMEGKLGITGKFGIGDILADMDALNIYKELKEGQDMSSVWESYYSSLGRNTRYKKFLNHRFPKVKSEEQLIQEIRRIIAPDYSLAIFKVYQQEGLEQRDKVFCKAAGECFAEYLWKFQ